MKKNTGKNGRIYIRISESEKNLIVEKAKNKNKRYSKRGYMIRLMVLPSNAK